MQELSKLLEDIIFQIYSLCVHFTEFLQGVGLILTKKVEIAQLFFNVLAVVVGIPITNLFLFSFVQLFHFALRPK